MVRVAERNASGTVKYTLIETKRGTSIKCNVTVTSSFRVHFGVSK